MALILVDTNVCVIVNWGFKACTPFRCIPADSSSYLGWFITYFLSDDAAIATKLHSRYVFPNMLIVAYRCVGFVAISAGIRCGREMSKYSHRVSSIHAK